MLQLMIKSEQIPDKIKPIDTFQFPKVHSLDKYCFLGARILSDGKKEETFGKKRSRISQGKA